MVSLRIPWSDLALPAVCGVVALGCWGWVAYDMYHKGSTKQLQRDAPIVATARGNALTAETQAAIVEAVRQGSERASQKLTTNQAKEVHYVDTIRKAGPDGLPDDAWRDVIVGMRSDRPYDSVPTADQREPATAAH